MKKRTFMCINFGSVKRITALQRHFIYKSFVVFFIYFQITKTALLTERLCCHCVKYSGNNVDSYIFKNELVCGKKPIDNPILCISQQKILSLKKTILAEPRLTLIHNKFI